MATDTKTPTEKAAAAPPPRGTAPEPSAQAGTVTADGSTSGHGIAGPDAQPQVSPSRAAAGNTRGGGASDAPAASPAPADTLLEGVYDGMPEEVYHGDPVPGGSLSSSGARLLLSTCPAIYRWQADHGEAPKRVFELGSAAHQLVLGVGAEIVVVQKVAKDKAVVDAGDYLTKSAQEHRDEIRAAGKLPLLRREYEQVLAMAAALREHPVAAALFDPDRGGRPEQSLFWRDPEIDVWRRARLDWLGLPNGSGRLILGDYKTTTSVHPTAIAKAVADHGYAVQDRWYCDGILALGLAAEVAMVFAFQQKTPPYLVSVVQLDAVWQRIGERDVQQALSSFAQCQSSGEWPGYSTDVELIGPPTWLARQYEDVVP